MNGLNPPAWMLVVPAVSDGANGSGFAHGFFSAPKTPRTSGPEVIRNSEEESTGGLPDHGAIDAVEV